MVVVVVVGSWRVDLIKTHYLYYEIFNKSSAIQRSSGYFSHALQNWKSLVFVSVCEPELS